jgi:ABC-type glutathione transport system ATPase component
MSAPIAVQGQQGRTGPIIEAASLRKQYAQVRLFDRMLGRQSASTLALNDVSLSVSAGERVGIVGESGSGKTTLARALVRLVQPDAGTVSFRGQDIAQLRGRELAALRRRVQLIYQDPYSSLNPAMTIGAAIGEPARVHRLVASADVDNRVADLMMQVGLSGTLRERRPAALSGGQRQRVAIARALAASPEVLIADEAVSALDVSIQAQILHLFASLQRELGLTLIFISHQLATVAQLCERVVIMYRGCIVEDGPTAQVFAAPSYPYTQSLLQAQPGQGRLRSRNGQVSQTQTVRLP